jgi:hypothetical protein
MPEATKKSEASLKRLELSYLVSISAASKFQGAEMALMSHLEGPSKCVQ